MTDWRRFVRARLPVLPIRPERESDIVEELALQLEAAFDAGLAVGLVGAIALGRVIDGQLVGITALNAPALFVAATALLAAGGAACLGPAARAVRINPVEALRSE